MISCLAGTDSQLIIGIAEAATAFGLLVFAGVQLWLTKNAEASRQRERALDKQDQVEAAYGVVWAEYNRIDALNRRFSSHDVLLAINTGGLTPEDVLPRDWGQSTVSLGQLGLVAAQFGAVAYTVLHDAAAFIRATQNFLRYKAGSGTLELAELVTTETEMLRKGEVKIRARLAEGANLLLDALEHAPNANAPRKRQYNAELHSQHARRFVCELRAAEGAKAEGNYA